MSTLQNKKDELTKELIAIKDAIDGIYKQELYENEYTLPESKYIKKEPMIHLDVDKILEDLKNKCCDINNISKDNLENVCENTYITDNNRFDTNNIIHIKLNYPSEYKLNKNEYIIKIFLVNDNIINSEYIAKYRLITKSISMIYITNYGRIIKSHEIKLIPAILNYKNGSYDTGNNKLEYTNIIGTVIYKNNKININHKAGEFCSYRRCGGYYGGYHWCGVGEVLEINNAKINLIEQPKLLYRLPKLFLDVIDAFHTQNTDLMQECCKTYLEISRESKVKESIMLDIKIKNISDEKDKILEQKDRIILDKDKEIEKLKKQLEEIQQKYDKIKSMFD
jgi:hypothetical protein